jgi:WD40 repeat protein
MVNINAISNDGSLEACVDETGKSIQIYRNGNFEYSIHTDPHHEYKIHSLTISSDNTLLVSGGTFGDVCIWNIGEKDKNELILKISLDEGPFGGPVITCVALSNDMKYLLVGTSTPDGFFYIYDCKTGQLLGASSNQYEWPQAISFFPNDNSRIITCGREHIKLWKWDSSISELAWGRVQYEKLIISPQYDHNRHYSSKIRLSEDLRKMTCYSRDGTCMEWDISKILINN